MLTPLFLISLALGLWRVIETNRLAEGLFDRTLLSVGQAIARDFAIRDGEALSNETLRLLTETSEGKIFYHVKGPDGSFVTGYATPPVNPSIEPETVDTVLSRPAKIYSGVYRDVPVRVLQLSEPVDMGWVAGDFVISVWQELEARNAFVRGIVRQTVTVLALLVLTVLVVTWFGLRLALRPLTNLEAAIARRDVGDLSPIKRSVPQEVTGIVATLNLLLDRISRRISSKDQFISNAAHQLRNPIAGVVSLTQSLEVDGAAPKQLERITALRSASQHLSRLSNQLLSFERNRELGQLSDHAKPFEVNALAAEVLERSAPDLLRRGVQINFDRGPDMWIRCEPLLVQEVLQNLIDNAVQHAGAPELEITISVLQREERAVVRVKDNGRGLWGDDALHALARFSQVTPSAGSGLGLAIARKICANHNGGLEIEAAPEGASVVAWFPKLNSQSI
ncbi:two-component system sensor histidine kinase TctE [Litoreibacter ponti]|uniref:histidine kinase n=2 Tax=Litoreibacter ponti TaxID=1510457 RepID=A0A2T6BCS9_9RHOB|nr:two-component system sensor histidine kinase TctE [Litoreibacter ponti]